VTTYSGIPEEYTQRVTDLIQQAEYNERARLSQMQGGTSLASFAVGDDVLVLREGDWIPGRVYNLGPVGSFLQINTEFGPVNIGTINRVTRPL
jgi:hypothetical protein